MYVIKKQETGQKEARKLESKKLTLKSAIREYEEALV